MTLHSFRCIVHRSNPGLLLSIVRTQIHAPLRVTTVTNPVDFDNRTIFQHHYVHNTLSAVRCYSTQSPKNDPSQPSKFWKYILERFNNYIDRYTDKLQKKSPRFRKVVDVVRVVRCVKFVMKDTKTYISVATDIWVGRDLEKFSRNELEVYYQMPKDILKLLPLLTLAAIPIIGNVFFIIGYWFPGRFLTHHFWTDEQKAEFFQQDHKKKCMEYRHILTYLDRQVHKHMTGEGREKMLDILKKVESHSQPTTEDLLAVKEHFESFPLSVDSLSSPYFRHLVKSCDMSTRRFPLLMYGMLSYIKQRRTPLLKDGYLLLHTDQVMMREGLDSLTNEEICKACLRRGLNPYGLSKEEQLSYLNNWTNMSSKLDETSISLLLHTPVLFTYNSPTNIELMKGKKYGWKRKT